MTFLEESDPRGRNWGTWVIFVAPSPAWIDPFAIFHGTSSTIAFADGHTESHRWITEGVIDAARRAASGDPNALDWPGGNAQNPDFVWVHDRYKHLKWAPLSESTE
jgi:prepilin-type processing-associated H-X9-DG protein